MKSAVKTIVGSCQSAGILVDGKEPSEILKEIDAGNFDNIIENGITEPSAEKKKILDELARDIDSKKKQRVKDKEAAKAAAEAAAKEAAAVAPAPGATPAAGAATPGKTAAPVPGAKPAAAKK